MGIYVKKGFKKKKDPCPQLKKERRRKTPKKLVLHSERALHRRKPVEGTDVLYGPKLGERKVPFIRKGFGCWRRGIEHVSFVQRVKKSLRVVSQKRGGPSRRDRGWGYQLVTLWSKGGVLG